MTALERELDALAMEAALEAPSSFALPTTSPLPPERRQAEPSLAAWRDCICACCRARSPLYEDAAEAARPARHQTSPRAKGPQLPAWRGWTKPVSLKQIDEARAAARKGQKVAPELRPFLAKGSRVYRITRAGIDRDRPLSIGMTKTANSIAERIGEHYRQPSRADPPVNKAVRNLKPGQILVQAAKLTRQGMHPRRAKNYEGWLQDRERPLLYDPDSTTFDEAGTARRY